MHYRGFESFRRNDPPAFRGGYNPEGAREWISELEKIFETMECPEDKKVTYATFMLKEEAHHWWTNNRRLVEVAGVAVCWDDFKAIFLEKYFPADVRNRKEAEFLMLQQGDMTVAEYAAKFEELSQYSTSF